MLRNMAFHWTKRIDLSPRSLTKEATASILARMELLGTTHLRSCSLTLSLQLPRLLHLSVRFLPGWHHAHKVLAATPLTVATTAALPAVPGASGGGGAAPDNDRMIFCRRALRTASSGRI